MLKPTTVKALQKLLGVTQYLSKFLPQLSAVIEPLCQPSHKNATWDHLVSSARHCHCYSEEADLRGTSHLFDPTLPVTLQCDAS